MKNLNAEAIKDAVACRTGNIIGCMIETYEKKIFALENRLKECENGYEGTLHLERRKLHDAEKKVKELTEENERLQDLVKEVQEYNENWVKDNVKLRNDIKAIKADTVRKMHSEIKERCIKGGIYPAFVARTIERVAKEIADE